VLTSRGLTDRFVGPEGPMSKLMHSRRYISRELLVNLTWAIALTAVIVVGVNALFIVVGGS
jgi:hypothetical protein